MSTPFITRLAAVVLLCLWQTPGWAQDPPPETAPPAETASAGEPPAAETPAETAPEEAMPAEQPADQAPTPETETGIETAPAAPAPEAEPAAAAPSIAAPPGTKRIVMLPVEFIVYQKSVAGMEAVPDWSETARFSLSQAALDMLRQDQRFFVVDAPDFDGDTKGLLREHVELFKLVGGNALMFAQFGGKAWAEKKTNFDYTIGEGLRFLAEASGADYAFLMVGSQVTQTGGAAFMQFLAAAGGVSVAGGGTFISAGIVDLKNGDLKWLNSRQGMQMFGITGSDARNPATAAEMVTKLFEEFPTSKVWAFPPF